MHAIELLESVDQEGRLSLDTNAYQYYYHPGVEHTQFLRECIQTRLAALQPLISRRFLQTKVGFAEIKLKQDPKVSSVYSFKVAPLLLLPDDGLKDMIAFLYQTRPFFEEHAGYSPTIRFFNWKDRNKRTYGRLGALYWASSEASESTYQPSLQRFIDERPVLREWLRSLALDLNRLGPWSWVNIRSDMVFSPFEDPTGRVLPRRVHNT